MVCSGLKLALGGGKRLSQANKKPFRYLTQKAAFFYGKNNIRHSAFFSPKREILLFLHTKILFLNKNATFLHALQNGTDR